MKILFLFYIIFLINHNLTKTITPRELYVYHPYIPNTLYYKGRKMSLDPPAPPPTEAGVLD